MKIKKDLEPTKTKYGELYVNLFVIQGKINGEGRLIRTTKRTGFSTEHTKEQRQQWLGHVMRRNHQK